jgi:hypothetical protein
LLSCVSKLLEKIVFKHIFNHLQGNKLLCKFQSGLSDEIPVDDNNAIKSYQEFDQLNTLESNNGHQHSSTTDATVGGGPRSIFCLLQFFSLKR